jgi:hypothetical protein
MGILISLHPKKPDIIIENAIVVIGGWWGKAVNIFVLTPRRQDNIHHEYEGQEEHIFDAINTIYRIMFYHRGTENTENGSAGGG